MTHEPHRIALLFPAMSEEQYAALRDDIKENGLHDPIMLVEDQILDGIHRYRACMELGLKPRYERWSGKATTSRLIHWVIGRNLHRRHLTPAQRSVLALKTLADIEVEIAEEKRARVAEVRTGTKRNTSAEPKKRNKPPANPERKATEVAAKALGVSGRHVERAKKIAQEAPDLVPLVESGEISWGQASKLAALPARERREALKKAKDSSVKDVIKEHAEHHEKPTAKIGKLLKEAHVLAEKLATHLTEAHAVSKQAKVLPLTGDGTRAIRKSIVRALTVVKRIMGEDTKKAPEANGSKESRVEA